MSRKHQHRRERNPHAQAPAEAARDRVEERRRRLLKLTGRTPDEGLEMTASLEALSPALASLGQAYADAARRMADTLGGFGVEARENMAATAAALGAAAPAAVRQAWELGDLVERARLAGVDVDAVREATRRHPTQSITDALERAIAARSAAPAPLPIITTAAELARRQRLLRAALDDESAGAP